MICKEKDIALFQNLRLDGRMSLTELSRRTKLPISTIYERLRLHYGDIIKKYTVVLDFTKLGYNVRVHFIIKVDKNNKQELFVYLKKHRNVNNLYRINNGYDYLCEGIFEHMQESEKFTEILEEKYSVKKVQSYYILEDLKHEEFFGKENGIH